MALNGTFYLKENTNTGQLLSDKSYDAPKRFTSVPKSCTGVHVSMSTTGQQCSVELFSSLPHMGFTNLTDDLTCFLECL